MLCYWTLDLCILNSFSRPPQAGAVLEHFVLKSHQVKTPESLGWSTRPPTCDERTAAHSTTLQPCPNVPSAVSALTPEGHPSFWAPSPILKALLSQCYQSGNLKCKFQLLHFTPAKRFIFTRQNSAWKSSPQASLYPVVFHPSESTTIPRTTGFKSHSCHEDPNTYFALELFVREW